MFAAPNPHPPLEASLKIGTVEHEGRAVLAAPNGETWHALEVEARDMLELIELRPELDSLQGAIGRELPAARVLPPLRPGKVVAIGLNYLDHCRESGVEPPA